MTCIVGLVNNGTVYMGADSAAVSEYDITVRADQKVFINSGFLIGFTTSFRMGQLLRYAFKPPKFHAEDQDLYQYMVTDFIDAVRSCLKKGGFAQVDKDEETGGCFLVGFRGRLFKIESDYQVGELPDGYDAAGCGQQIALGVLSVTSDMGQPILRVTTALRAAQKFNAGVREPFVVLQA